MSTPSVSYIIPVSKHFPPELRGVHAGDFKESMNHRWKSMAKMAPKLTKDNCYAFLELSRDPAWSEIVGILREDGTLAQILDNIRTHIQMRGLL